MPTEAPSGRDEVADPGPSAPTAPARPGGDFHLGTLRFMAGRARRELDAHDLRAERGGHGPARAQARLQTVAQMTQQRFAAAQSRRRRAAR